MSCKISNRAHKERCTKYKNRGQCEINKKKKQEKNERRIAKFAARRKDKQPHTYVPKDPETRGTNKMEPMGDFAWRPKMEHMVEPQKWTSAMRRIQNQIDKERLEMKRALEAETNKKKGKNNGKTTKD